MRLGQSQLDQYRNDGYQVFPGLLTPDEVAVLDADVPMLQSDRRGHADANVYTTAGGIRCRADLRERCDLPQADGRTGGRCLRGLPVAARPPGQRASPCELKRTTT